MKPQPPPRIIERFWDYVRIGAIDECWEWVGGKSPFGQGLYANGKLLGYEQLASRFCWAITYGPIPDGLCVLHKCDNPSCVNIKHLWLGTYADNAIDMTKKGRGRPNGMEAKITPAMVTEIRKQYKGKGKSPPQLELAIKYGVTQGMISMILRRIRYAWV